MSSMSERELAEFRREYAGELSISELASLQILDGLMAGDKDCASIYWTIQIKMLNKTNIANQINVNVNANNNEVSRMLDEISNKISQANAVAHAPVAQEEHPPTPQIL